MKKTYIYPELELIDVKTQQYLLADSLTLDSTSTPVDPETGADSPALIDDLFNF